MNNIPSEKLSAWKDLSKKNFAYSFNLTNYKKIQKPTSLKNIKGVDLSKLGFLGVAQVI